MSIRDEVEKAVRKFFFAKMEKRVMGLRSAALWDLNFGPYGADYYKDAQEVENWPGYTSAVEELEAWASENLAKVWVDPQTMEVLETEPEEDILSETYGFERRDVARIVFKELIAHGGMSA